MTARRIGGSIRHGSSPLEGLSISTRFMAEAITLTGRTRRRPVEIDALVALGGSRIARQSSGDGVPNRVRRGRDPIVETP
jgi:hypothetical protein